MKNPEETPTVEPCFERGLQSALEREFIQEYLKGKGQQLGTLGDLPETEARRLMREACRFASLKLAEIESRAHLRESIHMPS